MQIITLGINHNTASVPLREQLASRNAFIVGVGDCTIRLCRTRHPFHL